MTQAIVTGSAGSPCTCQLIYGDLLQSSIRLFKDSFRVQHTRLGPIGETQRDEGLRQLRHNDACYLEEEGYVSHAVLGEALKSPDTDQIRSANACLPFRVLWALVCGQSAMLWHMPDKARMYFVGTAQMLAYSSDCFDDTFAASVGIPTALDIFAYFATLEDFLSPMERTFGRDADDKSPSFIDVWEQSTRGGRARRSLGHVGGEDQVPARLPPLCLQSPEGKLSMRLRSAPGSAFDPSSVHASSQRPPVLFYQKHGVGELVPVHASLPAGSPLPCKTRAVLLTVDGVSWINLGHAINYLVQHVAAAFGSAYARGGLAAVMRERERVQPYVYVPWATGESPLRGKRAALAPWLLLLSARKPIIFVNVGNEAADGVPSSMDIPKAGDVHCHGSGLWGPVRELRKVDFDLFVELARHVQPWRDVSRVELVQRVWGRPHMYDYSVDPCLELVTSRCIRVLLVQRGGGVSNKANQRRIVNIENLLKHMKVTYPEDRVRVSLVEMESFTLAEEVALASITDVLIAGFGSAMWWGLFMNEGSCLLWLFPWLRAGLFRLRHMPTDGSPVWSRQANLEYGVFRDLWHVTLLGGLPSPESGLQGSGRFQLDLETEQSDYGAMMLLDVYVDERHFAAAFAGIVMQLMRHPPRANGTREMSLAAGHRRI
eukprot:TRINITY_DN32442_c0_g1_i1.p1 TRINITY_DN32442_c0_g1~~TRINITY_DN32442_c0_g1_i1.p1  ORF type:complete len:744 (+),score=63.24 TRINITY_DN32442_c0_g1_i1:259-2232(+)